MGNRKAAGIICVLMSTYNGEKYLRQQIDSILTQQDVEVKLLVRDDGSTDGTLTILDEYKDKGLLDYYTGGNLGPARSFLHLLQSAPAADFYAFADQDDYWFPDKLKCAVERLSDKRDVPALYYCQTQLADEKLNKIESVHINPLGTFEESLIYQFIGGCTMVLNDKARHLINSYTPDYLFMHDTWIYSVVLAVGGFAYFDKTPHILYRQHGNNAVGQGNKIIELKRSLKRFTNNENARFKIAKEIKEGFYSQMPHDEQKSLDLFLCAHDGIVKRLAIITNKRMRCSSTRTNTLFFINVLLKRI